MEALESNKNDSYAVCFETCGIFADSMSDEISFCWPGGRMWKKYESLEISVYK